MKALVERKAVVFWFNPFIYIAGGKALGFGLVAILGAALLGTVSNTHFDGVLDTHSGRAMPFWFFLSEGIIDWISLAVVLLIAGRLISRTSFRTIDIIGTQAFARWPTVFIALATLPSGFQRFSNLLVEQFKEGKALQFQQADLFLFILTVGVMLVCNLWMILLMYKSFSVSCNVKGLKAILTFVIGLILAEVLSKMVLYQLFRLQT